MLIFNFILCFNIFETGLFKSGRRQGFSDSFLLLWFLVDYGGLIVEFIGSSKIVFGCIGFLECVLRLAFDGGDRG